MTHHLYDLQMRDFQIRLHDQDVLRIESQRSNVDTSEIRKANKKKITSPISKHSPLWKAKQ